MSAERVLDLADMAEGQWGLFTSGQVAPLGVTVLHMKRYADRGLLIRVRQGVYRLAGAPESPLETIRAEWLALEPKRTALDRLGDPVPVGVVSHRSAAALQHLGDLDADIHQFTVAQRRKSRSPDVRFRVARLDRSDWHLVDGLPVTRPLRTVVDLASARTDGGHLAGVVRDTILTGDTTSAEVGEALRPYAHYYGSRVGDGAGLVRDLVQEAGVPLSALDLTALSAITAAALPSLDLTGLVDKSDIAALTGFAKFDTSALMPAELRDAMARSLFSSPEWAETLAAIRNIVRLAPALEQAVSAMITDAETDPTAVTAGAVADRAEASDETSQADEGEPS